MLSICLRLRNGVVALVRGREGQTLTEYALILMLVALVVFGAAALFGRQLNAVWSRITNEVIAAGL